MKKTYHWIVLLGWVALSGCEQDMARAPRVNPLQASAFFPDGRSARPLLEGTVAQGQLMEDELLYTGMVDGKAAEQFPFPITPEVLARGQERYNIFCSPCHDSLGTGNGMIVQRGFPAPPTYHQDRLRTSPPGYFFNVITKGFGKMYGYAERIPVTDRWAIIAYIRALQLSQNAKLEDVPEAERQKLQGEGQ